MLRLFRSLNNKANLKAIQKIPKYHKKHSKYPASCKISSIVKRLIQKELNFKNVHFPFIITIYQIYCTFKWNIKNRYHIFIQKLNRTEKISIYSSKKPLSMMLLLHKVPFWLIKQCQKLYNAPNGIISKFFKQKKKKKKTQNILQSPSKLGRLRS